MNVHYIGEIYVWIFEEENRFLSTSRTESEFAIVSNADQKKSSSPRDDGEVLTLSIRRE